MSSHGTSWYTIFSVGVTITYSFFLIMVSQCTFSLTDPLSLFNTFLCVLYVGFAILCFAMGMAVSLVGFEHAKRKGKSRGFYVFQMIYLVVCLIGLVAYRLA